MPFVRHARQKAVSAIAVAALTTAVALVVTAPVAAAETPSFTIEMKDGTMTPSRLEVPAGTAVKIIVKNTGTTPAEFESTRLRQEKVLSPGAESFIVLRNLAPGEYAFFDDFHPNAGQAVIVAK